MKTMIRKLALLIIVLAAGAGLRAQYPLAAGSPGGIYIFLDNRIPKEGSIRVERSSAGKGGENLIATVEAPKNLAGLSERIQQYEPAIQ